MVLFINTNVEEKKALNAVKGASHLVICAEYQFVGLFESLSFASIASLAYSVESETDNEEK